ncbi:MAG: lipase family protein [Leptolyngbyaceae cyanobacterium RM2_2_4]|nr:lipase family protein [Leptolyngbyaceae cyanobacterium RM2_2_4]
MTSLIIEQQELGSLLSLIGCLAHFGTQNVPFGFVVSEISSNDVVVVFRGTKRFIEWFKDANIQLVSYRDSTEKNTGKIVRVIGNIVDGFKEKSSNEAILTTNDFGNVTAGFREIYVSLRRQMIEALQRCPADSRIFVAGHSLGGALATLAIPDILDNTDFKDRKKIELYTFASPRCGDKIFATSFQKTGVNHWRIANTEDFVTMIPFPTGNVFQPAPSETPPELDVSPEHPTVNLGNGGVTGPDKNPNPFFGFIKAMYDRNKRRMPDYVHTGTPIYFTFHDAALERHHNLDSVYMTGIGQNPLEIVNQVTSEIIDNAEE